ncbi:MAG TPA: 16S rRNA (cytidine(1402)-2'-O)-methyltransferase [Vicinamibacterales bacterium]|nr:16S rRNA (cytidine(1402)-2'-O)-methyltransferase [Vicinamibacterales bacterium]
MPGTLFVVATPIGNLEDITIRALRVLREVAVIAAEDTRRTGHLLARHGIATPTTSLHEHNEHRKSSAILARLAQGDDVALVSDAGTPTVSDPGAELVRAAIAGGIRVEPIPGPSAVLTALTASGMDASQFTFLGFPPIKSKDRKIWFERLRGSRSTVVFFEAPHRIHATLTELREFLGDVDIVLGRELTKLHEEFVRGPISRSFDQIKVPKGEFTVVLNVGYIPEYDDSRAVATEVSRREELATLARSHGLTANQLYTAVEHAKKLVKRPT